MSLELFIKPHAELDLLEAYYYYEGLSDGIGATLVRCVGEKMEFISNNPKAYIPSITWLSVGIFETAVLLQLDKL